MNMVAASKFKSSQLKMENFRPYAGKFMDVLNSLALRVDTSTHPLLAVRDPRRIRVICMTSDRGLCGGFNTNLIKATERFLRDKTHEGKEVAMINVGRKGRDFFRKKANVLAQKVDCLSKFDMTLAVSIADEVIEPFIKAEYDELYLIYNQFVNVSVQRPTVVRLFPLPSIGSPDADLESDTRLDYVYEPSDEVLLHKLLPMYVHVLVYRALRRADPHADVENEQGEAGGDYGGTDGYRWRHGGFGQGLILRRHFARKKYIYRLFARR